MSENAVKNYPFFVNNTISGAPESLISSQVTDCFHTDVK